ncbi:MAG: helix-hairpin-helix domain-containing protein, partial [Candidatus Cloacimonetes bacterium]|nr:helix-hairpin-helix domain-containing protein [Candidatus Cloacimonadota bacterium]
MDPVQKVAAELNLRLQQVQAACDLLEQGNTIPFITRYRKEVTGSLDEVQLRQIEQRLGHWNLLNERRATILTSIENQGQLSDELAQRLLACESLSELEDLYLPYRPKRRTRASVARERGLAPLAAILAASACGQPERLSQEGVELAPDALPGPRSIGDWLGQASDPVDALAGARDIVAEWINEDASLRDLLRQSGRRQAGLQSQRTEAAHEEAPKFRLYETWRGALHELKPHQVLALNRGENLGILRLSIDWEPCQCLERTLERWLVNPDSPWREELEAAAADGLARLTLPSLGRDLRNEITQAAEEHSLGIFSSNLRQLLMQPPLVGQVLLGIDPGIRTGCKVAVIDTTGRYLEGTTIYPHAPRNQWAQSKVTLLAMIQRHGVQVCAIGNGTASRETESLVAEVIADSSLSMRYTVVSEAGASVYSASEEAREEFPDLDASLRGNISIARRLQDPLAELVKIDPRSLGVGQYQHDVDARRLGEHLDGVVEDCVNAVGVDLNTASAPLLAKVAGITRASSRRIVEHRNTNGAFRRREQLLEVKGIGPAAFQQSAGFLRIREGENSLDNTAVHPEAYEAVGQLARRFGVESASPAELAAAIDGHGENLAELAPNVGLGLPTLLDILEELRRPGRDPRKELDPPLMRGA